MSSLPAIGGHKAEIAIKPEYIVSSSSGYYPVKSEEVETDNEEDTNTSKSKNEHDQHINIKDEHHRVKVEVKTEDDSTDDECSSNNNKSTVELKSPQLTDAQASSKAIAEKEAIRQRVGYRYHVACDKRVCITTYSSISHIKKMITTKGPLYYNRYDFTRFCEKFKESDLDIVYPKVDGRGQLFPPQQYLARGELVRKWRQFSEAEQLNICNNHILPSDEDEEDLPPPAEPLTLPKDYIGTISEKQIQELASKVNLRRLLSLTSQIELNPTLLHTSIKAPIHVTGCSTSWRVVLHSIRYFYELDNAQQLEEVWKECYIIPSQRRRYRNNVRYLHKHRTSNAKTKDDRALDQARQAYSTIPRTLSRHASIKYALVP